MLVYTVTDCVFNVSSVKNVDCGTLVLDTLSESDGSLFSLYAVCHYWNVGIHCGILSRSSSLSLSMVQYWT